MAETSKNKIYYNDDENSIADILADMKKLAESADNAIETKVDKDSGKKLSTNDFTNEYKNKLDELNNYDDTKIKEELEEVKEENTRLKEDLNALPTVQGNGEYVTLDTAECRFKNFSVEGKSEQETTEGYNLCNIPNQTINGVTIINSNNGLILNGTCSSTFSIVALKQKVEAGDYIIKKLGDGASNATYQSVIYKNNNIVAYVAKANKSITFENDDEIRLQLYIYSGTVFNNLILPVQVCKDNDRPYEPYTGGIPSPNTEYPSKIRNVGDNINWFDFNKQYSSINKANVSIVDENTFSVTSTFLEANASVAYILDVEKNMNYCLNGEIINGNFARVGIQYRIDGSSNWANYATVFTGVGEFNYNISTNSYSQIRLLFYSQYDKVTEIQNAIFKCIQLTKGLTLLPYSPYGKGSINIKIQNENLLDIKELVKMSSSFSKVENGYTFKAHSDMFHIGVDLEMPISLPISISYNVKNGTGTNFRLKFWFDDGSTQVLTDYKSGTDTKEHAIVINNFTRRGATKITKIGFDWSTVGTFTITNFMISEGTTAKSYIEHKEQNISFNLDKPLYENCYLAEDGIHYNRKQIVLDGSENWTGYLEKTNTVSAYLIMSDLTKTRNSNILCNRFQQIGYEQDKEGIVATPYSTVLIAIKINKSRLTEASLVGIKTWLSNNPVTVEYELATEEIVPYTEEQKQQWEQLKNARSYEGQTHILSTDEISPNFNITARANLSEILNKLQGE